MKTLRKLKRQYNPKTRLHYYKQALQRLVVNKTERSCNNLIQPTSCSLKICIILKQMLLIMILNIGIEETLLLEFSILLHLPIKELLLIVLDLHLHHSKEKTSINCQDHLLIQIKIFHQLQQLLQNGNLSIKSLKMQLCLHNIKEISSAKRNRIHSKDKPVLTDMVKCKLTKQQHQLNISTINRSKFSNKAHRIRQDTIYLLAISIPQIDIHYKSTLHFCSINTRKQTILML